MHMSYVHNKSILHKQSSVTVQWRNKVSHDCVKNDFPNVTTPYWESFRPILISVVPIRSGATTAHM